MSSGLAVKKMQYGSPEFRESEADIKAFKKGCCKNN